MKKELLLAVLSVTLLSLLLASCGEKINPVDERRIFTSEATEITLVSAQLNGSVSSAEMIKAADVGFVISTSADLKDGLQIMSNENDGDKKFFVQVPDLTVSTTYYYKAILKGGSYYLEGDVKKFTTKPFQFAAVDLGLSVKWANANLGANAHYEAGDLYAWGEVEVKDKYDWTNYIWGYKQESPADYVITKYYPLKGNWCTWGGTGNPDGKTELDPEDDVARLKLGGKWRMPTRDELGELNATLRNPDYKWEWISVGGQYGANVTYLLNGNSVFFPAFRTLNGSAVGACWTSTIAYDRHSGQLLQCEKGGLSQSSIVSQGHRCVGWAIRPVSE